LVGSFGPADVVEVVLDSSVVEVVLCSALIVSAMLDSAVLVLEMVVSVLAASDVAINDVPSVMLEAQEVDVSLPSVAREVDSILMAVPSDVVRSTKVASLVVGDSFSEVLKRVWLATVSLDKIVVVVAP
jgi:hypothetical protein